MREPGGGARVTLVLVTIIWGLNWPSARFGLQDFSPWIFRTVSFGAGALVLLVIAQLPASTAGLGTLLVPVIGVVASMLLLGDRPTRNDLIGFGLIFVAALCALSASTANQHSPVIEEGRS